MLYADPFLTVYCCLLAALLGACMGSFLNCAAWRIVHGESVLRGRSHCDACGHVLAVRDLIPVVSYLAAHGRCRYCGAKLSRRHVLAEAVSALVFVTLLHYDISLQALEGWCVAGILLVCSFADLEGYIIPDRFIAVGVVLFIITLFFAPQPLRRALDGAIGGLAVAGCVLLLVLGMEKLLGREAMGGGDIKLLFLTGLFFGLEAEPSVSGGGLRHRHRVGTPAKKTGRRRGHPVGPQHRPWRLADGAVRPTDHRLVSGAAVILESEDEHFGKDRWL